MSIARLCDCQCHWDEPQVIEPDTEWATFGGKDVCWYCLSGCYHWQPHVRPELSDLEKQVRAIYGDTLLRSLQAEPLFKSLT